MMVIIGGVRPFSGAAGIGAGFCAEKSILCLQPDNRSPGDHSSRRNINFNTREMGVNIIERIVNIERMEHALTLFGNLDSNIHFLEAQYHVSITCRGSEIKVGGDEEVAEWKALLDEGIITQEEFDAKKQQLLVLE